MQKGSLQPSSKEEEVKGEEEEAEEEWHGGGQALPAIVYICPITGSRPPIAWWEFDLGWNQPRLTDSVWSTEYSKKVLRTIRTCYVHPQPMLIVMVTSTNLVLPGKRSHRNQFVDAFVSLFVCILSSILSSTKSVPAGSSAAHSISSNPAPATSKSARR